MPSSYPDIKFNVEIAFFWDFQQIEFLEKKKIYDIINLRCVVWILEIKF